MGVDDIGLEGACKRPLITATVITDASWCPNTWAGGWAAWIVLNGAHDNGTEVHRVKRHGVFHMRPRSSGQAEKWASFNGIWYAYQLGARYLLVQTDCLEVVRTGNSPNGYAKRAAQYWPQAVVNWRHVPGHTDGSTARTWVNNWCDKQAKRHMRAQRKELLR